MQDKAGRVNDNKPSWIEVVLTLRGNYELVSEERSLTGEGGGGDERESPPQNSSAARRDHQTVEGIPSPRFECSGLSVFQMKALPPKLASSALGHERDKRHAQDLRQSLSLDMCTIRGGTWRNGVLRNSQCQVQWPESGSSWGENEMVTYDGMCDYSSMYVVGTLGFCNKNLSLAVCARDFLRVTRWLVGWWLLLFEMPTIN